MSNDVYLRYQGHCPICDRSTTYSARYSHLRGWLGCAGCPIGSVPRERALALVLNQIAPDWRERQIHESSPGQRGISKKMQLEASHYVASHFYPDQPRGVIVDGFRNEDLEAQTFADGSFEIVVALDVLEHLFHPDRAIAEIYRTLRPGGFHICTFPIWKDRVEALRQRARLEPDGTIVHLEPPVYHGNPINSEGVLVTFDYGYGIDKQIAEWAPFDVTVYRFSDRTAGVLGDFTEVLVCRRP